MNQDIEKRLRAVRLPGPGPALRDRVLAAVSAELASPVKAARSNGRLSKHPALAAAACLLASLILNQIVNASLDRRFAHLLGPRPVPRQAADLASDIQSITDPETGQWALERLTTGVRPRNDPLDHARRLEHLIRRLAIELGGIADETSQERPQVARDLRGGLDRLAPGAERLVRLEHWNTA
jgi:hypothetical protein